MAAALLLVDLPESWFIKTRRKRQAKEAVKNKWRNCNVDFFKENCLGDELSHYKTQENASCTYATLRYATIHKHIEFQHMRICVDTAGHQGNASTLCCQLR